MHSIHTQCGANCIPPARVVLDQVVHEPPTIRVLIQPGVPHLVRVVCGGEYQGLSADE